MANFFGQIYRQTTAGESHGKAISCILDGVPAGLKLCMEDIQGFLDRRRPGTSALTSPRSEPDQVEILSGLDQENYTLGSPLQCLVWNQDQQSRDYQAMNETFRPSHSDLAYFKKYGIKPQPGGGRSSARETIGRVIAGAVGKQIVQHHAPACDVWSWIHQAGALLEEQQAWQPADLRQTQNLDVPHPDPAFREKYATLIQSLKEKGDSVGGCIATRVTQPPAGLGEPVFDKLEAVLAHGILSLPAARAFEQGSGIAGCQQEGSGQNDHFKDNPLTNHRDFLETNHSGGIQGGISIGEDIFFRSWFKPVSTIKKVQKVFSNSNNDVIQASYSGRHDPCVLPRAVVIVECTTWFVLADFLLRYKAARI